MCLDKNSSQIKRYGIVPEVAEQYRTSPAQIYSWVREGRFPANCVLRIGKKILLDLDALDVWATNGGSPTDGVSQNRAV
jgi:Helix-turn-helix domain